VFVSHRLAEVLEISSRLTVLRDGALVGASSTKGMTQSRITELMTGKTFDNQVRAQCPVPNRWFSMSGAVPPGQFEDISLTVRRGETLGITGLLGAGRTELALSLFGMTETGSGTIKLEGKPVHFSSNRDAIKAGVSPICPKTGCRLG
jgi:simple sugar transport system ATP-binding protein